MEGEGVGTLPAMPRQEWRGTVAAEELLRFGVEVEGKVAEGEQGAVW